MDWKTHKKTCIPDIDQMDGNDREGYMSAMDAGETAIQEGRIKQGIKMFKKLSYAFPMQFAAPQKAAINLVRVGQYMQSYEFVMMALEALDIETWLRFLMVDISTFFIIIFSRRLLPRLVEEMKGARREGLPLWRSTKCR